MSTGSLASEELLECVRAPSSSNLSTSMSTLVTLGGGGATPLIALRSHETRFACQSELCGRAHGPVEKMLLVQPPSADAWRIFLLVWLAAGSRTRVR